MMRHFHYLCINPFEIEDMNEDLANMRCKPIRTYNYAQYFEDIQYNGKILTDDDRKDFVAVIDETIAHYSEGLPIMYDALENCKDRHDDYHDIDHAVVSILQFVLISMIDSMVVSKYFILADADYDQRFMRGKLKVIINEGYKRLYGFEKNTRNKAMWNALKPILNYFPKYINLQYQELTLLLDKHIKSSSWWKDDRDYETHFDTENLYVSRQKEIIESKVMIDSLRFFNTFRAVNDFLWNMHTCIFNSLVLSYQKGEITE